jgi:hypothetical protein
MLINDLYTNKKPNLSEGMEGQVVFSGTGSNGSTYEVIQSSPTDFMIHANGKHIDTYGSLQRAMSVLKNEVPGLQQGMAETRVGQVPMTLKPGETDDLEPEDFEGFKQLPEYLEGQKAQQKAGRKGAKKNIRNEKRGQLEQYRPLVMDSGRRHIQ